MKAQLVQLVETGILDEPINQAVKKLLNGQNGNKKCKCTIHSGSTDIKVEVRIPFWSGCCQAGAKKKKSRVFEIILTVSRFIREAPGKLKHVTDVHKFERAIPTEPLIPQLTLN